MTTGPVPSALPFPRPKSSAGWRCARQRFFCSATSKALPSPAWLKSKPVYYLAAAALGTAFLASREKLAAKEQEMSVVADPSAATTESEPLEDSLSDVQLVRTLLSMPILVVLVSPEESSDEFESQLDKIVEECQEIHISDYHYFVDDKKGYFPTDSPAALYYYNPKSREVECYAFPKDYPMTVASVRQFLDQVREGKAQRFYPSEPRPPKDRHPRVKSVYIATTTSFKDVVLDAKVDVLVRLAMPSARPTQQVETLARVFEEDDTNPVRVVSMASFVNVPDPRYFGDDNVVSWKFFPADDKEHPFTYTGDSNNVLDILKWVSDLKKDSAPILHQRMKRAESVQLQRDVETELGLWLVYSYIYRDFFDSPEQRRATEVQKKLKRLYSDLIIEKDYYRSEFTRLRKELQRELDALERAALRRVKRVPDEDYPQALKEAQTKTKRVVVFFWREGCIPCMTFNPIVGKLSEDLPDVTVLKVNARVLNLPATPIFYLYENDNKEPQQFTASKFKPIINQWYAERGLPGFDERLQPVSAHTNKTEEVAGTRQPQGPAIKLSRGQ